MNDYNFCPRCIEDWEDDDGAHVIKGKEVPSDCQECGVCKDCEHMYGCSKRDDYAETPEEDRYVQTCANCKRTTPDYFLSELVSSEGVTERICGVCALELSNKALGIERTEFTGEMAEEMRQGVIAYYKMTKQL